MANAPTDALAKLREPFQHHQISKLPKPTKAQTEAVRQDFKKGVRCKVCGTWHHPDVAHLDYVGHAALTDRLLDADPRWTWDPVPDPASLGLPVSAGGMWIRLTVDGTSRYGFGSADGKTGGDAVKEVIGDALRNAAMRFGAALDLWHKGDLHLDDDVAPLPRHDPVDSPKPGAKISDDDRAVLMTMLQATNADSRGFCNFFGIQSLPELPAERVAEAMDMLEKKGRAQRKKPAETAQTADILDDEIPY